MVLIVVLWIVTPCSLVGGFHCCENLRSRWGTSEGLEENLSYHKSHIYLPGRESGPPR
jgi:hypothetical protein